MIHCIKNIDRCGLCMIIMACNVCANTASPPYLKSVSERVVVA